MSVLVVVGFPDTYRAAQVACELQRMDPGWADELALAVTVAWRDDGRLLIQQTVDPADPDSAAWSGIWASLIRDTLFVPDAERVWTAARTAHAVLAGGEASRCAHCHLVPSLWVERLGIPGEIMRDIGALMEPGRSAMLLILRALDPAHVAKQLRRFGGTVLRCPLDEAQDARIQLAVAAHAR